MENITQMLTQILSQNTQIIADNAAVKKALNRHESQLNSIEVMLMHMLNNSNAPEQIPTEAPTQATTITPEAVEDAPPIPEKMPKQKVVEYSKNVQDFFNKHGVTYDKKLSAPSNFDNLCSHIDEAIDIIAGNTVVYHHAAPRARVTNYKIQASEIKMVNPSALQLGRVMETEKATLPNASKADYEHICRLLKLPTDLRDHISMARREIKKIFQKVAYDPMTPAEVEASNLVPGGTFYLKGKRNLCIEKAYSYDINSFHPAMLCSDMIIPMRAGESKLLPAKFKIDDSQCALYAITVHPKDAIEYFIPGDLKMSVWVSNYTIKLLNAKKARYELIDTGCDFNAILYKPEDCMKISTLFSETVTKLYSEKKNVVAKAIITALFGTATEHTTDTAFIRSEDITQSDLEGKITVTKDSNIIKTKKLSEYTYAFARIKPIFYDYCRYHMYTTYLTKYDVLRIAVDSITISEKLDDSLIGPQLGMMKRELKLKNVIYPHATYSFKTRPQQGHTLIWNGEKYADIEPQKITTKSPAEEIENDPEEEIEEDPEEEIEEVPLETKESPIEKPIEEPSQPPIPFKEGYIWDGEDFVKLKKK